MRKLIRKILRSFIPKLSESIQIFIASQGYPEYCKKNLTYKGKCFETKFKLTANTSYQIEINATMKKIPTHEAILGINKIMKPESVCIDVGANVGTYSIAMVSNNARCVYAIEPGPFYERLISNIELNGLLNKVKPYNLGISNTPSRYYWAEDLSNPGNAHLIQESQELNLANVATDLSGPRIEVPTIRLSDFANERNIVKLDLIKIDVELMEWEVILSGKEIIEKFLPILVVETSRDTEVLTGENTVMKIFEYLEEIGYTAYKFQDNSFTITDCQNFSKDTFFCVTNPNYQLFGNISLVDKNEK
jgi:FkbM family methyltransferase